MGPFAKLTGSPATLTFAADDHSVGRVGFRRYVVPRVALTAVRGAGNIDDALLTDDSRVTTLTGLDARPDSAVLWPLTIVLLLAGVAVFLYLASTVVEPVERVIQEH